MENLDKLANIMGIDSSYLVMIFKSILVIIILDIAKVICVQVFKLIQNEKVCYFVTQNFKTFIIISKILLILLIWLSCLSKITTILSFISAALTIVIKDLIFNFFSGIYIKTKKPFKIEDRIEINGHKGDVVNIHGLSFELLEVNSDTFMGQSTGVIIHIPNSLVFTHPLRNYNKAFKYIWNEIHVKLPLDCKYDKMKEELLKIVNNNDIVKSIPEKLHKELEKVTTDYRIYYNNTAPTVYTKVEGNYIECTIRYLVHPKKARYVQSEIWENILKENKAGTLKLFKE